jgi:osmotically-inducible protein OsmY
MRKQGWLILVLGIGGIVLLSGCVSNVWTGAMLIYDRHHVYKKFNDYELFGRIHQRLYEGTLFNQKGCSLDVAVFNGDLLLAGHVPSIALRKEAARRVQKLGYRRFFNQLDVGRPRENAALDSWITTKIRSRIFADSLIDPNIFKVVTADRIVYLMGDVPVEQAKRVIKIARTTEGVIRVVTLLQYYILMPKAT